MGYRSNGGMIIFGPKDVMTAHLASLRMSKTNNDSWTCPEIYIYETGDLLVWKLEYCDWKWYDDYPDIQEFERIWSLSEDEQDRGISGFRWRFGEDDTDIESDTFGEDANFEVIVERRVDYDLPGPPEPSTQPTDG